MVDDVEHCHRHQREHGLPSRLSRRHSRADTVVDVQLEMTLQFLCQLTLAVRPPDEAKEPDDDSPETSNGARHPPPGR